MPGAFNGLKWVPEEVTVPYERLFHVDGSATTNIYELDLNTKLPILTLSNGIASKTGVGGISTRLYTTAGSSNHELDTLSLLSINQASTPFGTQSGIGGTDTALRGCDTGTDAVYNLNPDTLAHSGVGYPGGANDLQGMGGMETRLFTAWDVTNQALEINPSTKAIINSASSPSTSPRGMGGTYDRLYHCDGNTDLIYELNPDSLATLSSVAAPGSSPAGIGGLKSTGSLTKVVIEKASYKSKTFSLNERFLDTKPQ